MAPPFESVFRLTVRSMLLPSVTVLALPLNANSAHGVHTATVPSAVSQGELAGPALQPHQFSVAVAAPDPSSTSPVEPLVDVLPMIRLKLITSEGTLVDGLSLPTYTPPPASAEFVVIFEPVIVVETSPGPSSA